MDHEIDYEEKCFKCGHSPLHHRKCTALCEDGIFDLYDDDPINFDPGESVNICDECKGTGVEWWCPSCGENLSGRINASVHNDDNDNADDW